MRVSGEGPAPCRLLFVGEHVGERELETGRPFVGRTSIDFNARLNGYDLPRRDDCYLTNLIKERLRGKKPTQEEVARDAPELEAEIAAVRPEIIVTLGALSTQYFLGDVSLEMVHAIPHPWRGVLVMPLYHPAAGVHSPELGARHDYGMNRLALLLKGRLPAHIEDTAGECYVDATPDDVRDLFACRPTKLGIDTEGWTHRPWSIQASHAPGFALVMRSPEAIAAFALHYKAADPKPLLVFHPALHELPMLSAMGLQIPDTGFTDTSLKAHLLGIEPLGAKPLFFRHAGMVQDAYTEITAEASERIARDFLLDICTTWPRDFKPKAHWLEKTLRQIDRMVSKDEGEGATLRERWSNSRAREVLVEEEGLVGEIPEATLDDVGDLPRVIRYAGRDADGTLRIDDPLDAQIDAMGLRDALDADLAAVPMLNRMQMVGMGVDVEFFGRLSRELAAEWVREQAALDALVGAPLNVNSTKAVPAYLFDTLKLPVRKFTDGGQGSTNDKILEAMRQDGRTPEHARLVIAQIQDVREIRKIKSAFADAVPQFVRDGRIHPRFRIVSTGRLACSDPNLLAFPKHSARGLRIREGFVAAEGHLLGSFDLSQIEMRVFAIDCGDANMQAQFRSGFDFHQMGAAEKLGKKPADVTDEERFAQKACNFGVLMGITEHGLLDQYHKAGLTWATLDDMRRFLAEWFRQYPAAGPYIQEKHAEARRYGYVRDMWGRLRYLPGIRSNDKYLRQEAERQAQATPTQSGAQGLMRRWMHRVWLRQQWVREHEGWTWEPLLQVHDDIITELSAEKQAIVEQHVQGALDECQWFPIPITGKSHYGKQWSDL